jgi:hypothetical protein
VRSDSLPIPRPIVRLLRIAFLLACAAIFLTVGGTVQDAFLAGVAEAAAALAAAFAILT